MSTEIAAKDASSPTDGGAARHLFPLPDGLVCLALEFEHDPEKYEEEKALESVRCELDADGELGDPEDYYYEPGEKTIFGVSKKDRVRINIIAAEADALRWVEHGAELFRNGRFDNIHPPRLSNWKIIDWLPAKEDERGGFWPVTCFPENSWKLSMDEAEIYALLKENWNWFTDWVYDHVTTEEKFDTFRQLKRACRGDLSAVGKALQSLRVQERIADTPNFLVEGLVPKDAITLMLGVTGAGKSGMLLELACDAAMGRAEWHGHKLNAGHNFVVYIFGEDSPQEIKRRVKLLCGGKHPPLLKLIPYDARPIQDLLADPELVGNQIDLLAVDPARKFFKGDEDSSDSVSAFFNEVENFTRQKQCATIVSHHLRRTAAPRNIHDVPDSMRGSQVFLDRARVTLALHRAGGVTQFGIPITAAGPRHNLDERIMSKVVHRFRRDETAFRHVPLEEPARAEAPKAAEPQAARDPVERVRAALVALGAEDTSSMGADKLYRLGIPELAGMSRAAIRKAMQRLADTSQPSETVAL
jgi:hypothetical protein